MLVFVGIGPGDPELITRKAARILREADAIALPDSGSGNSAVMQIVGDLIADKPLCRLEMPMRGMREDWAAAHDRAAEALLAYLKTYPTVAYPVLGDPGVYASSSYLLRRIAPLHPCTVVPGIPAMCASAAAMGVPLCEQGEKLTVVDSFDPEVPLPEGNVVLMKSGKNIDALKNALAGREAYAARNLGMDSAWTGPLADIPADGYSYFTTVIVKP